LAEALNGIPDEVCFYGVASRNLEKAEAFKEKWGAQIAYGSYEELASDSNIDLIYIATPHSEHYKNAKLCLMNKKNILVEKAFCGNRAQAQEVIELGKKNNLLVAEAMWTRYQPCKDVVKQLLDSGIIGEPSYLEADFSMTCRGIERLEKPELAGGALLDVGIYPLTTAAMYFGYDIKSVSVNCTLNEYGVDLNEEIIFTYEDDKKAKLKAAFGSSADSNYAKIVGSRGYILFEPTNAPETAFVYDNNGKLIKTCDMSFLVNGYEYQVLECKEAVLNNQIETKSMPHKETIRMMGIMDSIREYMGVKYPWESDRDRVHPDLEVWGKNNIYLNN